MTGLHIKGVVFDMYGTLVDVGAVAEACKEMAPEPVAFKSRCGYRRTRSSLFPRTPSMRWSPKTSASRCGGSIGLEFHWILSTQARPDR
jgi:hypothetical protein